MALLELLIKTRKAKEKFTYNYFHNILKLFDVLVNFLFTTSETIIWFGMVNMVYTSCLTNCPERLKV